LGVIYGPVVDEFYFGDRREGHAPEAWCEQAGTRRAMPFVRPSPALCARSRHHHSKSAAAFAAQHGLELTPCGSALKFGRVAAGQYRAYGSFGNPAEWDAAPGFAIVEAAGGRAESLAEKFAWNTEALRAFPFSIWSGS
jgi:3'(2'), 5'-bisphosphate nucleotidase